MADLHCALCSYLAIDAADLREHVALNHGVPTLDLPIAAADIAAATLARHRRVHIRAGIDPAYVDSPTYRAILSHVVPWDVARAIMAMP